MMLSLQPPEIHVSVIEKMRIKFNDIIKIVTRLSHRLNHRLRLLDFRQIL